MIEEIPHPDPWRRAFLCGPDGAVKPGDVSIEDRQTIADFAAMLEGKPGCMYCMMGTPECQALPDRCCDRCRHVRLTPRPVKAHDALLPREPGSMGVSAPGEVPGPQRPGGD